MFFQAYKGSKKIPAIQYPEETHETTTAVRKEFYDMRDRGLEQGLRCCQDQLQELLQLTGDYMPQLLDSQKKLEQFLSVKLNSIELSTNPAPACIQH